MSRTLALCITVTDVLFMLYWTVAAAAAIGLVSLQPDMMYGDYNNPRVIAWNWSFFPLDVAFLYLWVSVIIGGAARRSNLAPICHYIPGADNDGRRDGRRLLAHSARV